MNGLAMVAVLPLSGVWSTLADANLWQTTLAASTLYTLGALGAVINERAGVVNIGIEGMMLTGAFFAVFFDVIFQNIPHGVASAIPWILQPGRAALVGLLAGMLTGGLMATLLAFSAIRLKADQIVVGMAINLMALGLTSFLLFSVYTQNGTPPACTPASGACTHGQLFTIPDWSIPALHKIPAVGQILFQQSPIVYLMLLLVVLTHILLFRTKLGLRIRAVGEHPRAADTAGINVQGIRYRAVIFSGLLSGLAGGYLSLAVSDNFTDNITSGRGFIALAAMIVGKWTPFGAFGACLLFGFGEALYSDLSNNTGPLQDYSALLYTLPYVLTIIAVAGFIGRATAPAADGVPYDPAG